MLQSYISANQQDWDEYLPHVAQAFNNTINSATGFSPYYLMFGTEMNMASEDHVVAMDVEDFHDLVRRTKEVQQWCWQYVGSRVVENSNHHNRVPRERLAFKPYNSGDFFFLRVVPKRLYKSENEEQAYHISAKLQFRYTGPYMVSEVISPVLYTASIHGKVKRVHAINMKPASKRGADQREATTTREVAIARTKETGGKSRYEHGAIRRHQNESHPEEQLIGQLNSQSQNTQSQNSQSQGGSQSQTQWTREYSPSERGTNHSQSTPYGDQTQTAEAERNGNQMSQSSGQSRSQGDIVRRND
eukprot:gene21959-28040_t